MKSIIFLFLMSPLICLGDQTKDYTLTELVKLHEQGSWQEVLENIEDVSPVKRDAEWRKLLIDSAEKGFDKFSQQENRYLLSWFAENIISRYSQLRKNKPFIFKVAKAIRQKNSDTEAIQYFHIALESNQNINLCSDEDLKKSVFSTLMLDSQNSKIKHVKQVAFGSCFKQLVPTIKDAINGSDFGMNNACREMIDKNGLKGITKKKCIRHLAKG